MKKREREKGGEMKTITSLGEFLRLKWPAKGAK